MSSELMGQIEAALAYNQRLLALAEQQEWSSFSECLNAYTPLLAALCAGDFNALEGTQRTEVAVRLAHLLTEDEWLRQRIQQRLVKLHSDIAAIHKSRHTARAYNAVP